jgi:hypothetical protein
MMLSGLTSRWLERVRSLSPAQRARYAARMIAGDHEYARQAARRRDVVTDGRQLMHQADHDAFDVFAVFGFGATRIYIPNGLADSTGPVDRRTNADY